MTKIVATSYKCAVGSLLSCSTTTINMMLMVGRFLLIMAAALGYVNSIIDLLLAGINTGRKGTFDKTALLCAAGEGRDGVV